MTNKLILIWIIHSIGGLRCGHISFHCEKSGEWKTRLIYLNMNFWCDNAKWKFIEYKIYIYNKPNKRTHRRHERWQIKIILFYLSAFDAQNWRGTVQTTDNDNNNKNNNDKCKGERQMTRNFISNWHTIIPLTTFFARFEFFAPCDSLNEVYFLWDSTHTQ